MSNGALSDGDLSDGALSNGTLSNGALSDGTLSDGGLNDGALSGAMSEGILNCGNLGNVTLSDGILSNGSVTIIRVMVLLEIDGTLSDRALSNWTLATDICPTHQGQEKINTLFLAFLWSRYQTSEPSACGHNTRHS